MKNHILAIGMACLSFAQLNAQNRKVLLEEFTGAHCGNCPPGNYLIDSLKAKYPNLIAVSLHAYSVPDTFYFPEIDSIGQTYSSGAPLASIDRINHGTLSKHTARYLNFWEKDIQDRLNKDAQVSIYMKPLWEPAERKATIYVEIKALENLDTGDYRFSVYVVEDSLAGYGNGYDQDNFYDKTPGNPFYGKGNPISGYVHRHVVRGVLPNIYGWKGLVRAAPQQGQKFTGYVSCLLSEDMNPDRVKMVGFVYRATAGHRSDEVLNAEEVSLLRLLSADGHKTTPIVTIYPNPASKMVYVDLASYSGSVNGLHLFDLEGREIPVSADNKSGSICLDMSPVSSGIYFLNITTDDNRTISHKIVID